MDTCTAHLVFLTDLMKWQIQYASPGFRSERRKGKVPPSSWATASSRSSGVNEEQILSTVTLSEFPGSVPMICVWEELYIIGEKQNKTGGSDKTVFFWFFLHLFKAILKHQASGKKIQLPTCSLPTMVGNPAQNWLNFTHLALNTMSMEALLTFF